MAELHVSCRAYTASLAPAWWARRVDLAYPAATLALVYDRPPPDDEWMALMLRLQAAALRCGFTITVYDAAGRATRIPPLAARQ